ncbi:MAG: type I DNA topoisomerase [Clostridia bacterium]|nr:type I DNA topoisomerase [Clostridia bacterium]
MSKVLVIVESPAKAKTIGKFLGKKYTVKASMGHVRDLPKSQFGVDVEHDFAPKYITIRGKGDILKELRAASKKADKILLAPDPDREGEAIAWHLQHLLKIDEKEPCRIEFNEITKHAIEDAVKHPRTIDDHRVEAQQARRVLDRLVGYKLSPLLWRKIRKGLSAGRVQSVAVRLICDREDEIQEFVPEEYWTLTGVLAKAGGKPFEAKLLRDGEEKITISNREAMDAILNRLTGAAYTVTQVKKREKKRNPAPPFITSTLQQEAYRKLNFPARKTMQVAQQLYEGLDLGKEGTVGLVTYIRTDSTRISDLAVQEVRGLIQDKFGAEYLPEEPRVFPTKSKAQDAHEAIRPTSALREPETVKSQLSRDQFKLYKLIWERFVACQMNTAVVDTTSVDIETKGLIFRATGSVVKFPGFMKLYIEGTDEDTPDDQKLLPELAQGDKLELQSELQPKQHFTQPPPRYTDASLIKTLEELGIGRPSTYAPTVETVQKRGYIVKEEKQFFPTELGYLVVDLLKTHFQDIIDVDFTAGMENKLDLIAEGEVDWVKVIEEFYGPFQETLEEAEEVIGKVEIADEVTEEHCPNCDRNLVIKLGRFGKFLACPGFPECQYTKPLLEATGVKCPKCEGEIVSRRSKKGRKFYGCSNYPECEFVVWDAPTEKKCPDCGEMLVKKVTKSKGNIYKCSTKGCNYREVETES